MVKIVYRVWRKNMLVCNGFIIGGINELVILVYSSNKFVIVFFRFLDYIKILLYRVLELSDIVICLVLKFDVIYK